MRRGPALLVALLVGVACAAAEPPAPPAECSDCATAAIGEPAFEVIGDARSVPDGVVTSLAEDQRGFLWIGTAGGLVRCDGYRFRQHEPRRGEDGALGEAFVRTLWVGGDGRLWIGLESDGVSVYDPRSERFTSYRHDPTAPNSLPEGSVRALSEDVDGGIWVGTLGGGLSRIDSASGKVERGWPGPGSDSALNGRVQSLLHDRQGRMWIGGWNGLLLGAHPAAPLQPVLDGDGQPLGGQIITRLFEDATGSIWAGTQQGRLYRVAAGSDRALPVADADAGSAQRDSAIHGFVQPNPDQVWLARDSGIEIRASADGTLLGRLRHDPARPSGIAGNEVRALLRDRGGLIWTGGYGGGLQRYNPGNRGFRVRRGESGFGEVLADPNIRAVVELASGEIWLGMQEKGVAILDRELRLIGSIDTGTRGGLGQGRVTAFAEAPSGEVWLASDSGLYRAEPATREVRRMATLQGRVRRLHLDARGRLWIGSDAGMYRLDPATGAPPQSLLTDNGGTVEGDINAFAETAAGEIWVGGDAGLFRVAADGSIAQPVPAAEGAEMRHRGVLGLLLDREQRLWVDTPAGLHRMLSWDGREARFLAISAALGHDGRPFGANLLQDASGRLWSHQYLHDPADDSIYELSPADGVDIGTGWFRAYAATRDGRMLFGGSRGLLVINPGEFQPSSYAPPLVISELRIDGLPQPLPALDAPLQLPPSTRSFSIEFAALDFSAPQRLRYGLQLAPYDPDWIETPAEYRVASYSNLPPGHYTLRLRGSNRSGQWSPHGIELPIQVLPHWWQTWWFRVLAGAAALMALVGVIQLRTAYLLQRRRWLEAKVRQRTAELEEMSAALQAKSLALEEASLTDPLTGLRNRRFLTQHLEGDVALALRRHEHLQRQQLPPPTDADLIFFLVDIDHFKQVNDEHGHAAGDAVLLQMRERLLRVFRDSDYLVRWGGEEFLIVARATDRRCAAELAERARQSVAATQFTLDDGSALRKTCSIGYASFPWSLTAPRALRWIQVVDVADAALYAAKRAGRDGWVGLDPGPRPAPECIEAAPETLPALLARGAVELHTSFDRAAAARGLVLPTHPATAHAG